MENLHLSRHPVVASLLTQLRAQETTPTEFRNCAQQLTRLLGYEATFSLPIKAREVQTPLQPCLGTQLSERIALVPILRAGLGMVDPMLEILPQAEVQHLGYYRDEKDLIPIPYYQKLPKGDPATRCFVLDPMLATGGSAIAAVDTLKQWGCEKIQFMGILGAPEGAQALTEAHPDISIHLCGLDDKLNDVGYIIPGLGDAGDRLYNTY